MQGAAGDRQSGRRGEHPDTSLGESLRIEVLEGTEAYNAQFRYWTAALADQNPDGRSLAESTTRRPQQNDSNERSEP